MSPVFVTLLHQFLRFESRFPVLAGSLRCSSTALTDDRLMPVCWRRGAVLRVWKGHVGSCRVRSGVGRVRAGSFPILDFNACIRTRFLAVFAEYHVNRLSGVRRLPRSLMRLQIPSQRESWDLNDDTLSAMTICLIGRLGRKRVTLISTFPPACPQTVHATFTAHGFPVRLCRCPTLTCHLWL